MRLILFCGLAALGVSAQAGDLKLVLHGNGLAGKTLYVAVHQRAENFPGGASQAPQSSVVATADSAVLVIPHLPAGEYAVAAYADMNGNGKLDSNFLGIPKEPVGVSRNAEGRFGPPKFADAAFKLGDGSAELDIQLK